MPNKLKVKVEAIYKDDKEVQASQSGENLRLRVSLIVINTDISSQFHAKHFIWQTEANMLESFHVFQVFYFLRHPTAGDRG